MSFFKNIFSRKNNMHNDEKILNPKLGFDDKGVFFLKNELVNTTSASKVLRPLIAYLNQLEEEDYAEDDLDRKLINWKNLYKILKDESHESSLHLLNLPPIKSIKPNIISKGSLADQDFTVAIKSWILDGNMNIPTGSRKGAVLDFGNEGQFLMPESSWECYAAIL